MNTDGKVLHEEKEVRKKMEEICRGQIHTLWMYDYWVGLD